MQDYRFGYHLGSWTFKVLIILNFSFSSSFFAITLWLSLDFQLLAFSIEILFSLYWVPLIALQFLTCWWSLFKGILGNKLLFFGSKRVQWKHVFKSFFWIRKRWPHIILNLDCLILFKELTQWQKQMASDTYYCLFLFACITLFFFSPSLSLFLFFHFFFFNS